MKKPTRRYFIAGGLAALVMAGGYGWNLMRGFGALPVTPPLSPNWKNGAFRNLPDNYVYDKLDLEPAEGGGWLKFLFSHKGDNYPPGPVSSKKIDLNSLKDGEFVWLGHSSFLIKLAGKLICIDPVLSSRASPIPFTIPAWPGSSPYKSQDFPLIDFLCISHDHWDHLDYKAIKTLKYKQILCGKGVDAHFKAWGVECNKSLDWRDEVREGPLSFIYTPSRHFSGRGFTRNQSLWGGFVIKAGSGGAIYFTGDGGYGHHFSEIGSQYGPFDIVFPDCGQYNRAWPDMHMFPEQAVMAVRDAKGTLACPCHFGRFTLAWHPWNEPVQRFTKSADERGLKYILPVIGEKINIEGK